VLVRHPESIAIVALDAESILVVRQSRAGAPERTVELPAGCIEQGESALEAAERELQEECGLSAARWRKLGEFWAAPAYSTERVHVLEARELVPAPAGALPDPDEDITVERRALAELPAGLSDATSIAAFALWLAQCYASGGNAGGRFSTKL
jgi:ADP-ribose pyrophosphatase